MKRITLLLAAILLVGMFAGCGGQGDPVPAEKVSLITGYDMNAAQNSYAGVAVSGQTAKVTRDQNRKILEVNVEEGDMVNEGDVLFSYDLEDMQLSLDKLNLELETLNNTVTDSQAQITSLQNQMSSLSASEQAQITLEISTRQADIREAEYNISLKEKEIETMEENMQNADITAPISGRVMSIASADSTGTSTSETFITIMDVGAYRIEGQINEYNRNDIYEGMSVVVYSRADSSVSWTGTVSSIDWENPIGGTESTDSTDSANMTSSSKYPFYVTLDDTDGLLLGEHVYIRAAAGEAQNMMLTAGYVVQDGDSAYVWAASDGGTLEKREVELGQYDEDTDCWEILSGLTSDDYIAWPQEDLSAGQKAECLDEDSFTMTDDETYSDESYGETYEDDMMYEDDGVYEEEYYEEDLPAEEATETDIIYEVVS